MKTFKKVFAFMLAAIMVLAMTTVSFAAAPGDVGSGNGTITINNSSKGKEYNFYKIFDAKANATGAISYTGTIPAELESVFETKNDEIVVKENVTDQEVIAALKAYVEASAVTATETANGVGGALVVTVPYGYYYITSEVGTEVTITSTNPDATVNDKNTSTPSWTPEDPEDPDDAKGKTIVTADGNVETITASIGDTINFEIKISTVNYTNKPGDAAGATTSMIKEYVVNDTPAGGIGTPSDIVVKIIQDGKEDVTITPAPTAFPITIPWADTAEDGTFTSKYDDGAVIDITYSAVLEAENVVVAGEGNVNTASFTYNFVDNTDGPDDNDDEATVYTYSFDLVKTTHTGEGDAEQTVKLTGAEFELYDALTGGNRIYVEAVEGENGKYRVTKTANEVKIVAGEVTIEGLGNGKYYLEETKAPAGYNALTGRQLLTINDANVSNTGDAFGVEVINNVGSTLPSTGGIGTTIFYVVGGLLVAGAGILLVTRKRMSRV